MHPEQAAQECRSAAGGMVAHRPHPGVRWREIYPRIWRVRNMRRHHTTHKQRPTGIEPGSVPNTALPMPLWHNAVKRLGEGTFSAESRRPCSVLTAFIDVE